MRLEDLGFEQVDGHRWADRSDGLTRTPGAAGNRSGQGLASNHRLDPEQRHHGKETRHRIRTR